RTGGSAPGRRGSARDAPGRVRGKPPDRPHTHRGSGASSVLYMTGLLATIALAAGLHGQAVLGKAHLLRYGIGWGTPHPRVIFNGGDPSGKAFALRWINWDGPFARARGSTWIFTPHGGYYAKPGTIELRAYRLGQCTAGGPRA